MTDLTIKYAKYVKYTPVADTLYHNEAGTTSVTGLDLSKYMYVTVRARAGRTFIRPTCASFAVKTITDCGGSFPLQMFDNKYYLNYTVTNTTITAVAHSGADSGYKIYEVIGYRWAQSIATVTEEPTPTYSYRYVKGQLSCASPQGKDFNNFYNSDAGTEFGV